MICCCCCICWLWSLPPSQWRNQCLVETLGRSQDTQPQHCPSQPWSGLWWFCGCWRVSSMVERRPGSRWWWRWRWRMWWRSWGGLWTPSCCCDTWWLSQRVWSIFIWGELMIGLGHLIILLPASTQPSKMPPPTGLYIGVNRNRSNHKRHDRIPLNA